jgi:hypothetical protein
MEHRNVQLLTQNWVTSIEKWILSNDKVLINSLNKKENGQFCNSL